MEQDRQGGITPAKFRMPRIKDVPAVKSLRNLAFFLGAVSFAALAACQGSKTPTPQESVGGASSPEAKPGIAAHGGRLVLPVVAGHPAAVYFSVRNDGPGAVTLASIHIAGAGKAEMHKTQGGSMNAVKSVELAPGVTIDFAPGGYHVMAFDLARSLKPGDTTELTMTFSDGDKLSMPLRIEALGDDIGSHDMSDHDMSTRSEKPR